MSVITVVTIGRTVLCRDTTVTVFLSSINSTEEQMDSGIWEGVGVKMSNLVQFLNFSVFSIHFCWQDTYQQLWEQCFIPFFQGMALFGRGRSDYDNLASESPSLKGLLLLSAQQDDHLCLALHWTGVPTCIFIHSLNLWNSDRSVCKLMDFALWVCGHMLITLEFPLERKSKCQFCNTNCNCHSRSSAVSFVWPETCWNPARRRHFFAWKPFKQYW